MNTPKTLKKFYWKLSARYSAWKFPINNSHPFIGITGTDGKTTTSSFLYEIAKVAGYRPLLITTVSVTFDDKDVKTHLKSTSFFAYSVKNVLAGLKRGNIKKILKNALFLDTKGFEKTDEEHRTTPLASEIRKLIQEYEGKGANFFILEVTSHSLDQFRVYGIKFDSIAYTNITSEHLDYHGSWERYAETKASLMTYLKPGGGISYNKDDTQSFDFLEKYIEKHNIKATRATYSTENLSKINLKNFAIKVINSEQHTQVTAIPLQNKPKDNAYLSGINIFGDYNIYNGLAAFSCFYNFSNEKPGESAAALKNLQDITGRMNFISAHPTVIVDFAHTPNAFEKSLSSASSLVKNGGRLWVIFGCAGLRDQYKRPEMGRFAYLFADNVLITSEDPRTESLYEINNQIIKGFKKIDEQFTIRTYFPDLPYEQDTKFIVRFDEPNPSSRRQAIQYALKNAGRNDVVIILGKGHETSICFGTKEFPWNDIEEVKAVLSSSPRKQ
jgi:UDP-N-acetylmuramoyl-L-alanyl-D-glutamate--2,6-diaminopimelate ligase